VIARYKKVALAFVSIAFLMAPTPGDTGGCGVTAESLDVGQFGAARKAMDCKHCTSCSIPSNRCQSACDAGVSSDVSFPDTCKPLREDGLICLRALNAASCDDYTRYMDEKAPEVPTECQFCRQGAPPVPTIFATDAGTPNAPTDGGAP
jgi:hypothetical protein